MFQNHAPVHSKIKLLYVALRRLLSYKSLKEGCYDTVVYIELTYHCRVLKNYSHYHCFICGSQKISAQRSVSHCN